MNYGYDRDGLTFYEMVLNQKTDLLELKTVFTNEDFLYSFNDYKQINGIMKICFELQKSAVEKCYVLACDILGSEDEDEEPVYVAFAALLVSIGNEQECYAYRKQIATFLGMTNADGFVMVHNHPSGVPRWSDEDRNDALLLQDFGEVLGVKLIDDVVVASGGCSSALYEEESEFDNWE